MEDYPRTLADFERRFRSEEACRDDYLFRVRWPEGFRCPRCGESRAWRLRSALWQCANCAYQASLTAGTIFQDTRTPVKVWFHALWWMTSQKNGVSALGLQRVLGLGSYQTAWCWLHKLRRAMVRAGRDRLSGTVEVDEAYVGAPEEGVRGRETQSKALIVVAAQEEGRGIGRIRMRRIANASADRLMPFVEESIEPGSVVHTDGWLGYLPLDSKGYRRQITVLRGQRNPSELLPSVRKSGSIGCTRSAGAGGITVASRCPFSAAEGISASTGPMFATGSEPKKPKGGNDEGTKRLHIPQREELVCAVLR